MNNNHVRGSNVEFIPGLKIGEFDGEWLVPGTISIEGIAGTGMAELIPPHTHLAFTFDRGLKIQPVASLDRLESGFYADTRIMPEFAFRSMTISNFGNLTQKEHLVGLSDQIWVTYLSGEAKKANGGAIGQAVTSFESSNLYENDGLHVRFYGTLGEISKGSKGAWPHQLPVSHSFEINALVPAANLLVSGIQAGWIPWTELKEKRSRNEL